MPLILVAVAAFFLQIHEPRDVNQRAQVPGVPSAQALRPPFILEFDLPVPPGSGSDAAKAVPDDIRGFAVGYFPQNAAEPRLVLEIDRAGAEFRKQGSVRISMPSPDLPAGTYTVRAKIQGLLLDSDWSDPSPPFWIPGRVSNPPRRSRPATPSRADTRAATKSRLQPRLEPSLAAAVVPLLPKGVGLADATQGFRKPVQFVAALLAARNLGIALADVKAKMFLSSGGEKTLGSALAALRPDVDAKAEARKASEQAQALVRQSRRKDPQYRPR